MGLYYFPELELTGWKLTQEKLASYAQLLADIKSKFMPHEKNWEESALNICTVGLTASSIPVTIKGKIDALDLTLNLNEHHLILSCGKESSKINFSNQTIKSFSIDLKRILDDMGVVYNLPQNRFNDEMIKEYNFIEVEKYWAALKQIYFIMLQFKCSLFEETSGINFWPHHFDLAMLLFSGRVIEGKDAADWSNSREQMNFGFSPGDEGIHEPYFYITAYPFNKSNIEKKLFAGAYWHTEGWNGAVLKYSSIAGLKEADEILSNYFKTVKEIIFG